MQKFIDRHDSNILGIHSSFDRLIVQGTWTDICYPDALTRYFFARRIKIFDFTDWAKPFREMLRQNAETIAEKAGLKIEFIRKIKSFRKDDRIQEIMKTRGQEPGLVHIFSAMETCHTFKPWHNKESHKTYFRYEAGHCLHYYFYFIDKEYGLCYLRVPTWAPFRLQFYCNGHSWVENQLNKKHVGFRKIENAFMDIDDFDKAQNIADSFSPVRLHRLLDRSMKKFCPLHKDLMSGVHWSIMQVEYATDIVFKDRHSLAPIYEELIRTLSHAVKPDQLSMFLGKRLDPRFEGELGSQFNTRIEGHCLRHHMGKCGIKMYDKFGSVLRIETFSNDVSFFKHHRRVEHRDGTYSYKTAGVKKTIHSLPDLAELMYACNRRYIEFFSAVDDPTNGIKAVNKVSRPKAVKGRSSRGFNLFDEQDETVFRAVAQGAAHAFGVRNKDLRQRLGKNAGQVSRILKRLRDHGIIKKVRRSYRYYLTSLGKRIVATSLKLKEMFIIPCLRGKINLS